MNAAVAGAVVAAVAPSGLCSEDVFAAVPASDPALAPSFSVDVDEGPFTLAIMSKIKRQEGKKNTNWYFSTYQQPISEVLNHKSKHAKTCILKSLHIATFHTLHKN